VVIEDPMGYRRSKADRFAMIINGSELRLKAHEHISVAQSATVDKADGIKLPVPMAGCRLSSCFYGDALTVNESPLL
tara:strand:- start:83 stop:313 length:231 start_codon:yes stop_codon:yes gene_type:complete